MAARALKLAREYGYAAFEARAAAIAPAEVKRDTSHRLQHDPATQ